MAKAQDTGTGLYPYPTDLPSNLLTGVVNLLRGGTAGDPKQDAHVVWQVLGYGLGRVYSDAGAATANAAQPMSREQLAAHVQQHAADPSKINWGSLVPILQTLLGTLLPIILAGAGGAAGS